MFQRQIGGVTKQARSIMKQAICRLNREDPRVKYEDDMKRDIYKALIQSIYISVKNMTSPKAISYHLMPTQQ